MIRLDSEQIVRFRSVLAASSTLSYGSCMKCEGQAHMIVLESTGDGKAAKSFAKSDECTCGSSDERKPSLSFAAIGELVSGLPQ